MRKLYAFLVVAIAALFIAAAWIGTASAPLEPAPTVAPAATTAPVFPPCRDQVPREKLAPLAAGRGKTTHVFLHYWGAPPPSSLTAVRAGFIARGWSDIAYNGLVTPTGEVWPGRPESMVSGATYGYNDRSVALCYLAYGPRWPVTDAQRLAGGRWLVAAHKRYTRAKFSTHAAAGPRQG